MREHMWFEIVAWHGARSGCGAGDRVLLSGFVVATHWLADGRPTRGAEKVELRFHLLPRIFRDCMHMAWETLAWLLTHVRRGP